MYPNQPNQPNQPSPTPFPIGPAGRLPAVSAHCSAMDSKVDPEICITSSGAPWCSPKARNRNKEPAGIMWNRKH